MTRISGFAAVLLAILAGAPMALPVSAQDDPFAPTSDAAADPFAQVQEPEAPNPFDVVGSPTPTPAPGEIDDPFAPSSNTGTANNPFEQGNTPFQQSGGTTISPFGGAPSGAPAAAPRPAATAPVLGPGRLGPRNEVRLEDPRLRRLAEIRGIMVSAANRGFQDSNQLIMLVDDVIVGDFNRVYAEVRTTSGMSYRSELEPTLPYISAAFPNPLQEIGRRLKEKHAVANPGAEALAPEVVGVMETLRAHNSAVGSRPPANNVVARFPEFTMTDPYGNAVAADNFIYLDPGNPQVRQYLGALTYEAANQTRPVGFLLTGLQYPSKSFGYSAAAIKAFRDAVGGEGPPAVDDPVWCAWRRQQLTEMLLAIRQSAALVANDTKISVVIRVNGPPPANWAEYVASPTYAETMQDWVTWCRLEVIDEIVFQVHERLQPQGNQLRPWIGFINNNVGNVRPVISLSGRDNDRRALTTQFGYTRERAVGTMLHDYADPARDFSRGFFASMRDTLLRGAPGRPVGGRPLEWESENRTFRRMSVPPVAMVVATATPAQNKNPLAGRELVFATPSPIPTPPPVEVTVPSAVTRRITLRNGNVIEVLVLEATANTLRIRPEKGATIDLPRSAVDSIDPPI